MHRNENIAMRMVSVMLVVMMIAMVMVLAMTMFNITEAVTLGAESPCAVTWCEAVD